MGRARHVIWLNKKNLHFSNTYINTEPILSSILDAGIMQITFAGKAGEDERGR